MPFCPNCGQEVHPNMNFCSNCGFTLKPTYLGYLRPSKFKMRDPWITLLVGFIPGLVGIYGLGHLYIGKELRGIVLLIIGITVILPTFLAFLLYVMVSGYGGGSGLTPFIYYLIIGFVIGFVQALDAFFLSSKYNKNMRETGVAPW